MNLASETLSCRQTVHSLDNDSYLHFSPSHCALAFHHFKKRIINSTQCYGMLFGITVIMDLWSTSNLMKANPLTETFSGMLKLYSAKKYKHEKSLQEVKNQFQNTYCTLTNLQKINVLYLLRIFNKHSREFSTQHSPVFNWCSAAN